MRGRGASGPGRRVWPPNPADFWARSAAASPVGRTTSQDTPPRAMLSHVHPGRAGRGPGLSPESLARTPSDAAVNLLHSAPETDSSPTPLPEAVAGATVDHF